MLRNKWILIVAALAISGGYLATKGLRLGLDLKGGIHLVLRVESDDAIRAELDSAARRVEVDLREKKIPSAEKAVVEVAFDPSKGTNQVRVTGIATEDLDRARQIVAAAMPELPVEISGADIVGTMSSAQAEQHRAATIEQALTTIRERVDATGVAEPRIQRQGIKGDRILVQLPGVQDAEQVKRLIGRVAFLELRLVDSGPHASRDAALARYSGNLPPNLQLLEGAGDSGNLAYYVVERGAVITGRDLARALPNRDRYGAASVSFTLNGEGARKFGDATGKNVGRNLAIVLDGNVKSAPSIKSKITDSGEISGSFTELEARELALVLRAGALPAKIQYLEERSVGPWLGKLSIQQGIFTGIIGLALISLLMLVYYRLAGLNAILTLIVNAVLLLGALSFLDATLTLPGIAGFILTLGMAVDANVLVFEAIRENLRGGMAPKRAIEAGFSRAFTTIFDSNLTTMMGAGALWMLGAGPVRGFGVTLFIGLVANIFTAYFVSKTLFESTSLRREFKPGETLSI